jgi:galactofuranose transport system permease protein
MINGFTMNRARASLLATVVIAFVLLLGASLRYNGFFSLPVFVNLIDDNAFLGIAAIGMTFVILSGGIDLSVGAMIGATSIASALLVERAHLHPVTASLIVLAAGGIFGAIQGTLIARFDIAPFLVTLAGMFFLRGAAYTMSLESVALTHPAYRSLESLALPLGTSALRTPGVLFFLMAALGIYVARHTRFGRGVYAIGGNAQSALLMGLPSKRILTLIYVVSGLCSALAGITYTIYTSSGSATAAMGLELDVIAAVVIGGTLLTGGQGSVLGTLIGVVILGAIQTIITFEGTLSSWWTRIVIGGLLFFFVALQRLLAYAWQQRARKPAPPASPEQDSRKDSNMTSPRKMAVVSISFLLFASANVFGLNAHAQVLAPVTKTCPPGYQAGAKLDSGLYQLTGTHLKVGDQASDDVPDPAPPYIGPNGEVEIYGSSLTFVRYPSWQEFEAGGCFEMVPIDLVQDNLVGYPDLYSRPWDVRKFRIEPKSKPAFEIIIAGTMSRTGTRDFPLWPEDNTNRRLFFYRKDASGRWVRDKNPIVGKVEEAWVGHSYGGNIVQVGMKDQNVVRPDDSGEIALFYEKVSNLPSELACVSFVEAHCRWLLGGRSASN